MQVAQDLVQLGFKYLQGLFQAISFSFCAKVGVFLQQMDLKTQLFYISLYYQFCFLLEQYAAAMSSLQFDFEIKFQPCSIMLFCKLSYIKWRMKFFVHAQSSEATSGFLQNE